MILKKKICKVNYNDILDLWLQEKRNMIKISSYMRYSFLINNYISKELGSIDFKKINDKTINNFFCLESIESLSDSTKKLILIIIKSSIKFGIENKLESKIYL